MPKGPRTAEVSRRLVDAYVTTLRQHLPTYCIRQLDKLPRAEEHQLTRLRQSYPGTPAELLYLLQRVNGTCWETLQAPPGSVPPSAAAAQPRAPLASATVTATAGKSGSAASTTSTATTTTAGSADAGALPTAPTYKTAAKSAAKATAAAAMASEAAVFIKSQIAKKVNTMAGPRQRRPLPHFVALPILGSTCTSCPYYLKSVEQMLVAEQQFPPPPATLPDEGEGWAPPKAAAATQSSSPPLPSTPKPSLPASTATAGGGLRDAACVTAQFSGEGGAAGDSPPSATSCVTPNAHSIASVYSGYKIVYGAPPPLPPPSSLSAGSASNAAASYGAPTGDAKTSFATTPTPTPLSEEPRVVYVDPRIDIHASFHQWLVFADSVQPHVRGSAPITPDADPAKMTAAAATRNAADSSRFSPARASPHAHTPSSPPKHFAASRLYIDFKPVELHGGVYGQVIQFVHGNPDSFSVVASDFGEYLKYIMTEECSFTEELEDDDDDEGVRVLEENCNTSSLTGTPPPPIITSADGRPLTSPTSSLIDVQKKR
ncbi:hypothetical protein LMJF_25_1140 [Leishmania major strain Friedlin]|uniref:Knr4/Smi1-like domain-containing protein n=1 Tax=Leishmania major TaxID=5664 RepID=Q4Q9X9_LEIMA|nr:hypothetical protein LMJF_25_1140 [Leishmania major strain Friedlin]CAG9575129.1 hypothetical_protein_-_conserved [Leishmania major strain Friedlin]CAJ05167.1 hypothetical protein LMJF_25_1140 [Leishmania major strain Friedlin]|eukprot:XP_001683869.1 hypothetical protein LMJF_25_1140 [Leishmania major strain Friedlin]